MISNGLSVEEFPNPGHGHTVLVCPKLPSRFNNNVQPTWRKLFTKILKVSNEVQNILLSQSSFYLTFQPRTDMKLTS